MPSSPAAARSSVAHSGSRPACELLAQLLVSLGQRGDDERVFRRDRPPGESPHRSSRAPVDSDRVATRPGRGTPRPQAMAPPGPDQPDRSRRYGAGCRRSCRSWRPAGRHTANAENPRRNGRGGDAAPRRGRDRVRGYRRSRRARRARARGRCGPATDRPARRVRRRACGHPRSRARSRPGRSARRPFRSHRRVEQEGRSEVLRSGRLRRGVMRCFLSGLD